jgi:hypothetical protein
MQTPMLGTRHELVARQCGAVQEKHQGDTEIGDHAKVQRAVTGSDFGAISAMPMAVSMISTNPSIRS